MCKNKTVKEFFMNDIEDKREDYNNKYIRITFEKAADFLRRICPDDVFYKDSQTKTDRDFWERLQMQDNICSTDYYDYKTIFDFCVKRGIKRVFDVGGSNGFANFVIQEENLPLEYIVVERMPQEDVFAPVISKQYPVKIEATPQDALISHLCMGISYTPADNKRMFNRAIQDFDHIILHTSDDTAREMQAHFPCETLASTETSQIHYFDTSSHEQFRAAATNFEEMSR